jgi:hypothetical protein
MEASLVLLEKQSTRSAPEHLEWLTAESALGRVREATLVRASLISGEPCKPEALTWLRELTTQRVLKALWAAQVLRTLHDRGLA